MVMAPIQMTSHFLLIPTDVTRQRFVFVVSVWIVAVRFTQVKFFYSFTGSLILGRNWF